MCSDMHMLFQSAARKQSSDLVRCQAPLPQYPIPSTCPINISPLASFIDIPTCCMLHFRHPRPPIIVLLSSWVLSTFHPNTSVLAAALSIWPLSRGTTICHLHPSVYDTCASRLSRVTCTPMPLHMTPARPDCPELLVYLCPSI